MPVNSGGPIPRHTAPSPPFEREGCPRDTPPKPSSMRPDAVVVASRTRSRVMESPSNPKPKVKALKGKPSLVRGIIFDDGAVKCTFSDLSSIVLDPTGQYFTAHDASGETARQLSEFAISRFAPRLRASLEFRNTHVEVPYCPPCVTKPAASEVPPRSFRVGRKIPHARWSESAAEAEAGGHLTRLDGGGVALESIDGIARVVLSAHGLMAHVTFPVLFATRQSDNGTGTKCDYVWQTQTFCADTAPTRWSYPIDLLTDVLNAGEDDDETTTGEDETTTGSGAAIGPVTAGSGSAIGLGSKWYPSGSVTVLPETPSRSAGDDEPTSSSRVWLNEGDERWWAEPDVDGFPSATGRAPVVELAEGTVMWAVKASRSRCGAVPWITTQRMEALANMEDGSALVTTKGGSCVMYVADERGGRASAALYLSEAVPETVAGAGGYRGRVFRATGLPVPEGVDATEGIDEYGRFAPMLAVGKVPIGKVTPRLVAFRTAAEFVGDVWAPHSMEVVEELRADGDGWYTAYADGRVRVVFNDRTQLNLSKDRSMVRMLTPDVEKVEVRVDDPGEWSKHVIAALEFAGWAYLTPEEREAAAEAKIAMVDRIQAEIDRNRRMVSIISGKPGKDCYNDEELNELAVKAAKSGMATEFNTRVARLAAARAVPKRSVGFNGEPIEMPDSVRMSLSEDASVAVEPEPLAELVASVATKIPPSPLADPFATKVPPSPPMSVEEMLARTSRWLEEVKHVSIVDEKEKQSPSSVLDSAADYPDMTDEDWSERTRKRLELVKNSIEMNNKWLRESMELRESWRESESGDGVETPPATADEDQPSAQEETVEKAEPAPPVPKVEAEEAPAPEVESEPAPPGPEVEAEPAPPVPEVEAEVEDAPATEVEQDKVEEAVAPDVEEKNKEDIDKKQGKTKKKKKKGK